MTLHNIGGSIDEKYLLYSCFQRVYFCKHNDNLCWWILFDIDGSQNRDYLNKGSVKKGRFT